MGSMESDGCSSFISGVASLGNKIPNKIQFMESMISCQSPLLLALLLRLVLLFCRLVAVRHQRLHCFQSRRNEGKLEAQNQSVGSQKGLANKRLDAGRSKVIPK